MSAPTPTITALPTVWLTQDLFPPLTEAERGALKDSIRDHGYCGTPIHVDEDGNGLDGRHLVGAIQELRRDEGREIPDPKIVVHAGLNLAQKLELATRLNTARRHWTREDIQRVCQRLRELGCSIRGISEALGVPRSTVGRRLKSPRVPFGTPAPVVLPEGLVRGRDGKTYHVRQGANGPSVEPIEEKKEAARYTVLLDDVVKTLSPIRGKLRQLAETQSTLDVEKLKEERPWVATKLKKIAAASAELSAFVSPSETTAADESQPEALREAELELWATASNRIA